MVDGADYFRGYARDIGVSPPVGGFTNVQDALGVGGAGVTLGNFSTDLVQADAPTHLTSDGAMHNVDCLIAAPPAWMDNAGNVTAAGLYYVTLNITVTAPPTTPGLFVGMWGPFNVKAWAACDGTPNGQSAIVLDVQALAVADVPFPVTSTVVMPTDATFHVDARVSVDRLAH